MIRLARSTGCRLVSHAGGGRRWTLPGAAGVLLVLGSLGWAGPQQARAGASRPTDLTGAASELELRSDPLGAVGLSARGGVECDRIPLCAGSPSVINGEAYAGNDQLWQTDFSSDVLRLIDLKDDCNVLATCPAPGGAAPSENTLLDGVLYHYDFDTGLLYGIDPATCAVVSTCNPPGDDLAEGLTNDGEFLWKGDSTTLYKFDPATCTVVDTCPNPAGDSADGLSMCGEFLILLGYSGIVYQIDPETCEVVSSCTLNEGAEGNGIAADRVSRLFADQPGFIDQVDLDCGVVFGFPNFVDPTPCGVANTVSASVGVAVSFDVVAVANTGLPGEFVTLSSGALPPGATMMPPLPVMGQPAMSTFDWTPTPADVGQHLVVYTAVDQLGQTTACEVTIDVEGDVPCFTLDFETDDTGAPMPHGTRVDLEFDGGPAFPVTITGSGDRAAILDSDSGPAMQDPDLLVGSGNILILQTDANTSECPPASGIFCTHNDDEDGGTLSFAFQSPAMPLSIDLIDIDAGDGPTAVILTDTAGNVRTYTVPGGWTGDLVVDGTTGTGTLDLTDVAPQPGFAAVATQTSDAGYDGNLVVRIDVELGGSGAVDDLSWCGGTLPLASAVIRNGSGVNAVSLQPVTLPVLGGTWSARLDCGAFGNGLATLVVRRSPAPGSPTLFGERLIGGVLLHRSTRAFSGDATELSWEIPDDLALFGVPVYAQGLCRSSAGSQKTFQLRGALSNALDLVLGF